MTAHQLKILFVIDCSIFQLIKEVKRKLCENSDHLLSVWVDYFEKPSSIFVICGIVNRKHRPQWKIRFVYLVSTYTWRIFVQTGVNCPYFISAIILVLSGIFNFCEILFFTNSISIGWISVLNIVP